MKNKLRERIGNCPSESGIKKRMRFHQGWWRAFVLAEDQGRYPHTEGAVICNTIIDGHINRKNFLTDNIYNAVQQTIQERIVEGSGILEENRLFNNLLSSQPLCFNFFGEFKIDKDFALQVLQKFWPRLTKVHKVLFEYSPPEKYTNDNSAFDIAFEVQRNDITGLIGLECKYTDDFSKKEYDKEEYQQIFRRNQKGVFREEYQEYIASRYNQLFRNQLIAEALLQNRHFDFVYTGLFCHQDDTNAIETALNFQRKLNGGQEIFKIITYQELIAKMQQSEISWNYRELSMLLWARYCGMQLSENVFT